MTIVVRLFIYTLALFCGPTLVAWGQQAQVRVNGQSAYVGEPVLIQVRAEGFDEDPAPQCDAGSLPEGLSLQLVGVSPSVSSYTQVINGKVTSYRRVVFVFNFQAWADQPGDYALSPFTVRQGNVSASTLAITLKVRDVPIDPDMRVSLTMPEGPMYPGQRVPVKITWWYAGDLGAVRNLIIRSPMFERFEFIDPPVQRGDTTLPIATDQGTVHLKADATTRTLDGREYQVFTAERQLVLDKPGDYNLPAISVNVEKVTRWARDVFGRRQPAASSRWRAVGQSLQLQVKSVPFAEAPASFAGAVGKGFTLAVEADRTVVHLGDPITLTATLRGQGNLETAGLGTLSADGGLDPSQFRLPTENDVVGTVTGDGKVFALTVRVLSESVSEVSPIAYSWFDPDDQQFHTTRSDPIALRVLATEMVSAQDVVVGQSTPTASEVDEAASLSTESELSDKSRRSRWGDLTGADLSISQDPGLLTVHESDRFGGWEVHAGVYAGSLAIVALAAWRRKASEVDPALIERRRRVREQNRRIVAAANLPPREASSEIAAALRQLSNQAHPKHRRQMDDLLAACDVVTFAPRDRDVTLDACFHQRAKALAQAMIREAT